MNDIRNVIVGDIFAHRIIDLSNVKEARESFGQVLSDTPDDGVVILFDGGRVNLFDIPRISPQNVVIRRDEYIKEAANEEGMYDPKRLWPILTKVKDTFEKYGIVMVTVQPALVAEPEPKLDATCTELDEKPHIRPTDNDYWYQQYWHLRSVLRQAVNRHTDYKGMDTAEIAQALLNDKDVEKGINLFYGLLETFRKMGFHAGYKSAKEMYQAEETDEPHDPTPTGLCFGGLATGGKVPVGANPPEIILRNDDKDVPEIPEVLRQILEKFSTGGLQPIGVVKIA